MSKKLTIEEMKEIAIKRGGECLSETYKHSHAKLKWQCGKGHKWYAVPTNVKSGDWCPKCRYNNVRNITFQNAKKEALKRGGKCLSTRYINYNSKLRWICKEKHIWNAMPSKIILGRWCPKCSGFHQTIEDMQKIAKKHGGKCLSKTYVNNNTKLQWECKMGHRWYSRPRNIAFGSWCPICARKKLYN